jgi:hypothetical protein
MRARYTRRLAAIEDKQKPHTQQRRVGTQTIYRLAECKNGGGGAGIFRDFENTQPVDFSRRLRRTTRQNCR